jgi:multidrug resistance efflux pump
MGEYIPSTVRLVTTPRAARTLATILAVLGVIVSLSLWLVPWVQTANGTGRVVAYAPLERPQTIEAPIEGRIVRWWVRESTRVKAGEPVVEISDNDPAILERLRQERTAVMARLQAARARTESVRSRVGSMQSGQRVAVSAAQTRIKMAADRVRAAEQALEASNATLLTAQKNHERQQTLGAQGLTSRRAVELAELDLAKAQTDQRRAQATLSAARGEQAALTDDSSRVQHDTEASLNDARASINVALAEEAAASAELARIEVRLARQSTMRVVAPRNGTILRLLVAQGGEMVKAGDSLAVIVPDTTERAAELWISGLDAPLVSAGRRVRLQFEGWPSVQFSGWPSVAVGTFGGTVALVDSTDDGKGRFRVVVVPDHQDEAWPEGRYLRQGVRVNGWILLNTVPLGYELWRQFNGFPASVTKEDPSGPPNPVEAYGPMPGPDGKNTGAAKSASDTKK